MYAPENGMKKSRFVRHIEDLISDQSLSFKIAVTTKKAGKAKNSKSPERGITLRQKYNEAQSVG